VTIPCFAWLADRFGRRTIFTVSLLWYSLTTAAMALSFTPAALLLWRFIAGVGIGVELVTIDTYLAELVPPSLRGRAFAVNQIVQFAAVPAVAFLSWLLVPQSLGGGGGWRGVVLIGASGALAAWVLRRGLPESPRWLAAHGRLGEAEAIVATLEAASGALSPPSPPSPSTEPKAGPNVRFHHIFRPPYARRTVMMVIFQFFQTIGFYGFASWVPTFIAERGIHVTGSLLYSFLIALANPFGPLLAFRIADRIERKWLISGAAFGVAFFGLLFAFLDDPRGIVLAGLLLTLCNTILSFSFHAYQSELFPTPIRARAVGFVYSWSRLSAMLASFIIGYLLQRGGTMAVFMYIAGAMAVVILVITLLGPPTTERSLEDIAG
jgi:putative MFS transporter